MKRNIYKVCAIFLVAVVVVMSVGFVTLAEAGLLVEEITGPVEVAMTDELLWQTLTRDVILEAGNHIRTGKDASVRLKGEDGSTLYLGENTQIAVVDFVYSEAQQTRVCRLKMWFGILTAEASKLVYKTNVFEVETNTVVAGIKFSSMTLMAKHTKAQGDTPYTKILPLEGTFEMRPTGEGITDIECLLETAQGGITFSMDSAVVAISVDQTPEKEVIALKSDKPLKNLTALTSEARNSLQIDNASKVSQLQIEFQRHLITLEQEASTTFIFPLDQSNQKLQIKPLKSKSMDIVFRFGRYSTEYNELVITANRGVVAVDGQIINIGSSYYLPLEEIFIVPPAPESRPARPVGSPILP